MLDGLLREGDPMVRTLFAECVYQLTYHDYPDKWQAIAKRLVQLLIEKEKNPRHCKVLVLGITFKENVSDIRNTKVVDLVRELMDYSINVHIYDPFASPNEIAHEYKITLNEKIHDGYDAVVVAVGHQEFRAFSPDYLQSITNPNPVIMDLKGIYDRSAFTPSTVYWRL